MFTFARRAGVLAGVMLWLAAPAFALDEDAARRFVADIADRATTVLASDAPRAEQRGELREILRRGFDLDFIGRSVLGPTFRSLSDGEQERYLDAFRRYVLATYSRRIDDYGGEELEIVGAEPMAGNDVRVESRVVGGNTDEPVRIDWRVRDRGGSPKIIDVLIEDVSMAISQRSEFSSVINQRGVDGLIALLEERAQASS